MMNGKGNQNPLQMNNMGPMNGMNYNSSRQYHHNNNHPQVCVCVILFIINFLFNENRYSNILHRIEYIQCT